MKKLLSIILILGSLVGYGQEIALLKYKGGGDWYSNPTSLPNLIAFCNKNINTKIAEKPVTVEPSDPVLFTFPFVHMTGHGNVFFDENDVQNLHDYLISGGFLHIDDNYGMHDYVVEEIKKLFPNIKLEELSAQHPIFSAAFDFPKGLPKIHEHDGKRPQAFGITHNNRLVLLFTYESDLGNGWENQEIHNDPEAVRQKALKMGANLIKYVFEH
ncbi:DUF4159 domain-containing protein [Haloflavibacter putidus]|uniref:DUF4159 domain-containing protein n=1 Tax=Haloflavibacter putidus TaxID=2576776 RepID=A0A507ZTG2_9FLAO|nr:DUF4159 domain-containing protein [Haloflavibacter putidus]TQD40207.1 DUF4159 domain-containing protein [Haloflavibacter putidus]